MNIDAERTDNPNAEAAPPGDATVKKDPRETPAQKQARRLGKLPIPTGTHGVTEINTPNSAISLRDSVTLSVSSTGFCVLSCSETICGDYDFVGLYINASQPVTEYLAWQWSATAYNTPYTTTVAAQVGYVAIYWSYDYRFDTYVAVCITPTLPSTNPGTIVSKTST